MSDDRSDAGATERVDGRQNAMTHEQAAGPDDTETNEGADRRARVAQPDGTTVAGFGQDHPDTERDR
ncbi:MAG TPA: hypothetical protein VHJ34_00320 [Actinomycetota bacterium]|nr:hypothetical protein [Actinomycetota bacterium]